MHELYRLVYISKNDISGLDNAMSDEIEKILDVARMNNEKHQITGALMFNRQCFAQVLEGGYDEIQETFEKVQCDFRHSQVTLLSFEETPKREFANWSMAYHGDSSAALEKFNSETEKTDFQPETLRSEEVVELLKRHMFQNKAA